eukprot:GCRY01000226.1.p1 GENE.GCRY01000226.1~~GCRY01000226.1.p1  ORF type:complete len:472 (-),score=106.06 GCRY01000226.1:267-1682(-)
MSKLLFNRKAVSLLTVFSFRTPALSWKSAFPAFAFLSIRMKTTGLIVRPFEGYRPEAELTEKIPGFPYDVLDSEEARKIAQENEYSILHINKPEVDLPKNTNLYSDAVYAKGAENLEKFIKNHWLVQDSKPCFYLYAQTYLGKTQHGLVALCSAKQYEDGLIKKHESTREIKENDRTRFVTEQNANVGPAFFMHRQLADIEAFFKDIAQRKPAQDYEYPVSCIDNTPVRHTLWVIDNEEEIEKIIAMYNQIPTAYIADGHHRSAAATRVWKARRTDKDNGHESHNFFLSVIFPCNELTIFDYNRVVKTLNGLTPAQLLEKIEKAGFTVKKVNNKEEAAPKARQEYGLYVDNCWYSLKAQNVDMTDPVGSLDVAVLTNRVLSPILGIEDLRKNSNIDFVGGVRGLGELEKRVAEDCKVAFALFPTTTDDIIRVSDAKLLMPPKSTWFEPKLNSGLVIRKYSEKPVYGSPAPL